MHVTITDGNRNLHQKSGLFGDRILKRSGGKKQSEASRSDCSFNFLTRKFWFLYLNIDIFASLIKKKKFGTAVHYCLSLIGQSFYHLFCSLRNVIPSLNSLYEVQIIDVDVLCENAHLKHFVFGDTTGPAKVSRVHCRCRPDFPVLVSKGPW